MIRRDDRGAPTGVLMESATRLVTVHLPAPAQADLEADIATVARQCLALGVVACHDPGPLAPDPDLTYSFGAYAHLAETGRLPMRVHASLRADALDTALAGGLRSGDVLGGDPAGRARIGWQKTFADGSLGSRTAALLADIEPSAAAELPATQRRGVWVTTAEELAEQADEGRGRGISTQIHAIGDAAVRAALGVLETLPRGLPLMPRIEHVQLLDPADRGRFAAGRIAASVQPLHVGSDAEKARRLWGARAEANGYTWASIDATGAVIAFGTDAPVEAIDPWPGLALAVRREDPRWAPGTPPFGPDEAIRWTGRSERTPSMPPSPRGRRIAAASSRGSVPISWSSRRPPSTTRSSRVAPLDGSPVAGLPRRRGRVRGLALDDAPRAVELAAGVGEEAVEDPRRRREGVDRLGEHVDRDACLDREHALVDRRRGVRAGHGGPRELAGPRSTTIVRCPMVASTE